MPDIVVCVATYQRPDDLRRLLISLTSQVGLDRPFGIAVVDNDPSGSARDTVKSLQCGSTVFRYTIEPEPGIPAARNRSLALAREMDAGVVAFIDDDESASPHWLATMYRRLAESGADAVSGPVEPIFPDSAPAWAIESGLFERPRFEAGRELDYASTANSMLRLSAIEGIEYPFDPELRYTGGSDSFLTHSLRARGGRIVWEPAALVYEFVPEQRISMRWLAARSYRQGITLARCDRRIYGLSRKVAVRGARGLAQIPTGLVMMLAGLPLRRVRWRHGVVRTARGVGTLAGLVGLTYEEYRRSA